LRSHGGRLFPSIQARAVSPRLNVMARRSRAKSRHCNQTRQLSSPVAVTGGYVTPSEGVDPLLRRVPRRHPMGYRQALLRQRVADDCAGIPAAGDVRFPQRRSRGAGPIALGLTATHGRSTGKSQLLPSPRRPWRIRGLRRSCRPVRPGAVRSRSGWHSHRLQPRHLSSGNRTDKAAPVTRDWVAPGSPTPSWRSAVLSSG
jgi:hypothetical protein